MQAQVVWRAVDEWVGHRLHAFRQGRWWCVVDEEYFCGVQVHREVYSGLTGAEAQDVLDALTVLG